MKKALVAVLLACMSVFICSCNKFSIGTEKTITLPSLGSPFHVIEFCDDVNVKLLHCDATHAAGTIQIKAGENLIDNIGAVIQDSSEYFIAPKDTLDFINGDTVWLNKLVISNNNTLSFLHSYDYSIEMTVYYDSLYHLIFNSNADNIRTDTLTGYNYPTQLTQNDLTWTDLAPNLLIEVEGGSGSFNMLTNCYRVTTKVFHGTSDVSISGIASIASTFADYDCHGTIDGSKLYSHIHYVTSHGTNRVFAKAYSELSAHNDNTGEIHYIKFIKQKYDFIPADETYPYGHYDWVSHYCPENLKYNGQKLNSWNYDNSIPGLVKENEPQ